MQEMIHADTTIQREYLLSIMLVGIRFNPFFTFRQLRAGLRTMFFCDIVVYRTSTHGYAKRWLRTIAVCSHRFGFFCFVSFFTLLDC
jgi:hypothetical protein